MTIRVALGAAALASLVAITATTGDVERVRAQSIFDTPRTSAAPKRTRVPNRGRPARPERARRPTRLADVASQDVVQPPIDVELDEDSIYPVTTRLGLITVLEFGEQIDYIWFSDSDRWRIDQDAYQLGLSPGKGDTIDVGRTKWSEVRETLYVRVADGFTYKFALIVASGAPMSFVRVHRKEPPPPPGPSPEEIARAEEARRKDAAEAREKERERMRREAALSAARAVPLATKARHQGALEVRLATPIVVDGRTYLAYELRNRARAPLMVTSVVTAATTRIGGGEPPASEIVVAAGPLAPGERRLGVIVIATSTLQPKLLTFRLQAAGTRPLAIPLGERP